MARSHQDKLNKYPNEYPQTWKNCVDCAHFKVKMKLHYEPPSEKDKRNRSGFGPRLRFEDKSLARCTKRFLVRIWGTSIPTLRDEEPTYVINNSMHRKINMGWRHTEWNAASVCPYFESMGRRNAKRVSGNGPQDRNHKPDCLLDSDRADISAGGYSLDGAGGNVGRDENGNSVFQEGQNAQVDALSRQS
jgi:hypothetical protein